MPRTIPCLWFDGNAEDAANYYVSVFPNYGLSWQVVPTDLARWASDPAKSAKVMQAVAGMKKLDLGALRRAAGEA